MGSVAYSKLQGPRFDSGLGLLFVCFISMWISSGFNGFLPPPTNMPVGGLATQNGVNVCAVNRCPIQGVFPLRLWSWDRFWFH